jgi:hypothetical protein
LYPCPRERCVEFDRKRSIGRKVLRHPPSSSIRSNRRSNILKESDENIVSTTSRDNFGMHQMEKIAAWVPKWLVKVLTRTPMKR